MALFEDRKGLEAEPQVAADVRARSSPIGAKQEVLFHGELRKEPATLGYERDAKVDDRLRSQTQEVDPLPLGLQKDLTVVDRKRDTVEHPHSAIAGIDIVEDDPMCQGKPSPQRYGAGFPPASHQQSFVRRRERRSDSKSA